MPHDVQVELAADRIAEIDIGREDRLLVVHGSRDDLAERVYDAASAARHDRVWGIGNVARIIGRIIAASRELVAAQDETPPFERNASHAREPALAAVGR